MPHSEWLDMIFEAVSFPSSFFPGKPSVFSKRTQHKGSQSREIINRPFINRAPHFRQTETSSLSIKWEGSKEIETRKESFQPLKGFEHFCHVLTVRLLLYPTCCVASFPLKLLSKQENTFIAQLTEEPCLPSMMEQPVPSIYDIFIPIYIYAIKINQM